MGIDMHPAEVRAFIKRHGCHPTVEQLAAIRVKVERTCPRCHARAYHLGNDGGVPNRISCVNCGHIWTGRIRKDEQS